MNKKIKNSKVKFNKGELAVKIMAAFLAIVMLLSVCGTLIYYAITNFAS